MEQDNLPKHIAIIMDGNRRWAKNKNLPVSLGHKEGAKTLEKVVRYANKIGIKYITVYAFSTENWKRTTEEVTALMNLFQSYLDDYSKRADSENIKVKIIGNRQGLSEKMQKSIEKCMERTKDNTGIVFNIALNYGGRDEILGAVKNIAKKIQNNEVKIEDITEQMISDNLYTANQPDPDLLIRTSGELRLSNFLPWQLAYTEFLFVDKNWPDFNEKDLDDAIHVEKLENGNYKLDVHIADVSHYVREKTELDKEAYLRGTSIYMLGRVIPMLPRELSNGICSLNAGEDRYTLSCSMEITPKAKIVSSDIYKGVICVTERMCYTDVQKILDRSDETVLKRYEKYIKDFELMAELATILKERRLKQGYLNLDIPESKIDLDEEGRAINVGKYETSFSNEIIEQFMLSANEAIAEKFYWLDAPFIYRVHEDPDLDKIKDLNKFLFNFGLKIKVVNEKIYPTEVSKILEEIKGKDEEKVVSTLILRTLKVARYESENKGHFGIASKYYCHFTSPIRRYPDLFIHRIISKYLEDNYVVDEDWIEEYQEKAEQRAASSSDREKVATKVERDSEDLKKAEYMQDKIGEEYDGIVSSVTQFGIFVELENTVEGLIRFENLGDEYFIYDEERKRLIGERTNTTYKIGDKVKIRVISANKMLRQIDFEIVK